MEFYILYIFYLDKANLFALLIYIIFKQLLSSLLRMLNS